MTGTVRPAGRRKLKAVPLAEVAAQADLAIMPFGNILGLVPRVQVPKRPSPYKGTSDQDGRQRL